MPNNSFVRPQKKIAWKKKFNFNVRQLAPLIHHNCECYVEKMKIFKVSFLSLIVFLLFFAFTNDENIKKRRLIMGWVNTNEIFSSLAKKKKTKKYVSASSASYMHTQHTFMCIQLYSVVLRFSFFSVKD